MYDTVSVLFREVPERVRDPRLYDWNRSHVEAATGEVHRTYALNTPAGLHLTLHEGGLQVERSLPKALTGQNIVDLEQWQVGAAIERVDAEVEEALGRGLASVADGLAVRVDYCQSVRLGDESRVRRSLDKFAGVELPYKGLPVRGQNHSVAWPVGAIRPKAYSKFSETRRNPAALGVLRFESEVRRAKAFRDVLARAATSSAHSMLGHRSADAPNGPALRDVLLPEVHSFVLGRFADRLRGDVMSADELGDLDFGREMLRFFGWRRTASLLGYCLLFLMYGVKSRNDMLAAPVVGSLATRYRIVADLNRFRLDLVARGLMPAGEEDAGVVALVERIGQLREAA
jgi:hypothetical protein